MPTKFRGAELGRGPTQAQTRIPRPPSPRVESYSRQGWSSPARDVTPLGGASGTGVGVGGDTRLMSAQCPEQPRGLTASLR